LIMPGVTVGKNSIVAAGSVVVKSVPEGSVVGGNPARVLTRVDDYIKKHHIKIQSARVYDEKWTVGRNISLKKRCQMANELNKKTGYVK
ncbi:acyltransferase, partial [Rossellomorea vietnamensis]